MIEPTRAILAALLVATAAAIACRDITRPVSSLAARTSYSTLPAGTVSVTPTAMNGWAFTDDRVDTLCTDQQVCALVDGPSAPPLGIGSAELATVTVQDAKALRLIEYAGLRFDRITELRYSTFRQTVDAGNNLAVSLQFNADYDLSDSDIRYQGRLVFEPYQAAGGTVSLQTWQNWDAKGGRWWGTKAMVPRGGVLTTNPCVQATPCTWAQLLATFPDVGVHASYGAVYLKAGSGWPGFRGNVDALSIGVDGVTTTFDFERTGRADRIVPALAPNIEPAMMNDAAQWISGGDNGSITLHRSILIVRFQTPATQAQRQAAIDSVGGTVVGGRTSAGGPDGLYYVSIPSNGTAATVYAAADKLSGMPQVRMAVPHYISTSDDLAYRRPRDGGDWGTWKLDPAQAGGEKNWSSELLNLPFAWGCSTGDTATHIAVIDAAFHTVADDSANVRSSSRLNVQPTVANNPATWHGDAVTEILAATGDDRIGMTGTAWRASVHQMDAGILDNSTGRYQVVNKLTAISANAVIAYVDSAVTRYHARVINLSSGSKYPPDHRLTADEQRREDDVGRMLYTTLSDLDTLSHSDHSMKTPLLVIAAGNSGQSTRSSGWAQNGAGDLSDRVMVVTASRRTTATSSSLPSFANYGNEVTIAAPGQGVWARTDGGSDQSLEGTSFAAPAVAGIATLLFSFDASLTAQEARRLILDGAGMSGRVARDRDGYVIPVADAYAALRLAAKRPGAPLCGNRIWNDGNNKIIVERDSMTLETIIADRDPWDYAAYVNPFHGGKRIELGFSYRYDWNPVSRSFEPGNYANPKGFPVGAGGGWTSYTWVADHDNTMWVQRVDTVDATGQVSILRLHRTGDTTVFKSAQSPHLPGTMLVPAKKCIMLYPVANDGTAGAFVKEDEFSGNYECVGYGPDSTWSSSPTTVPSLGERNETPILGSMAPQGDAVFVPVNVRHFDIHWSEPFVGGCAAFDADSVYYNGLVRRKCPVKTVDLDSAVSAMVYRVDTLSMQWTLIPLAPSGSTTLENREINSLEVSEDGKEIMLSMTRRVNSLDVSFSDACHDETLEWISIDRSAQPAHPPGTVLRRVTLPQGAACGGIVEAGGTVSPIRSGTGPLKLLPTTNGVRLRPTFFPLRQQSARRRSGRPATPLR